MLLDIARNVVVAVRFGLQPNTSPSSRRGGEIEQDRSFALLGDAQRHLDYFLPRK
jgi:hypothetical protein